MRRVRCSAPNMRVIGVVGLILAVAGGLSASGGSTSNAWELDGNAGTSPGTDFLGTTDDTALEVKVNGNRALRVEPSDDGIDNSPNLIGGHSANQVDDGNDNTSPVVGATIGGGGMSDSPNVVGEDFATVGGGEVNTASGAWATVGGGLRNTASGNWATVGGGVYNTASGTDATVPGGDRNTASGREAFASGKRAAAEDDEAFVWNDDSRYHSIPNTADDGLSSSTAVNGEPVTGSNTFSASATGGVRFITHSNSLTYISGGSTGWSTTSSRESKTNIDPVDPERVLVGVARLELSTWEYRGEDGQGAGVRHLGPMAGAFHEAMPVELGSSEDHINSINLDGVALTAVQALYERNEQLQQANAELKQRVEQLEEQNEAILERLEELEAQVEDE